MTNAQIAQRQIALKIPEYIRSDTSADTRKSDLQGK